MARVQIPVGAFLVERSETEIATEGFESRSERSERLWFKSRSAHSLQSEAKVVTERSGSRSDCNSRSVGPVYYTNSKTWIGHSAS